MYKIDSIGGANEINVNKIGKNGYFLVIDDFLLYEHVEYFINLIKMNNDKQKENDFVENYEIIFYNL